MYQALIVEDNTTFRRSLRELLCSRFPSMTIREAKDGNEALAEMEAHIPHLVFMDIRLPGANGLEITKRIKAGYDGVVVIVLTSYDLPEYREAAYRSGASHFFAKGSTSCEEITGLVESVISAIQVEPARNVGLRTISESRAQKMSGD